jgi:hypothetical protein
VGLSVKIDDTVWMHTLSPELSVQADRAFQAPEHWREWLGSIRSGELEQYENNTTCCY